MRQIEDILHFRQDISPFLVHLTRRVSDGASAGEVLRQIIDNCSLRSAGNQVSDARFGMRTYQLEESDRQKFFAAVCFTETPISEIHCLLDIGGRSVSLEPYGLVLLKQNLQKCGVSPVMYLNNEMGGRDPVARALCSLIETHRDAAADLLPLISVFGRKLQAPGANMPVGEVDFRWEREWRYPFSRGPLAFRDNDVFVGLCPHEEIATFEDAFPPVAFIDPRMNMKWYATKLVEARQRLDLKDSVV